MIFSSPRTSARQRTQALGAFTYPATSRNSQQRQPPCRNQHQRNFLSQKLREANIKISPAVFIFGSILFAGALSWALLCVISPSLLPCVFLGSLWLPVAWLEKRILTRAKLFAEDYPTVLLATASSLKIGLPPSLALERSVQLLPQESLVRIEMELLIQNIRRGVSKEQALSEFAVGIRLIELDLFRQAFLLLLENGGKFAPTLERLATTSRDRADFISRAQVTTSAMRMTANILMFIIPIVLLLMASGNKQYWTILLHHPTAHVIASLGIAIIAVSYGVLRRMSTFRP